MTDITLSGVTCASCGAAGSASKFCPNCGAVQASSAPPTGAPAPSFVPPIPPSSAASNAPYPAPGPPPRKRAPTWVKVLAIVGACFLTLFVGCVALVGTAANEVSKELAEETSGDASDASEVKASAALNEPLTLKGTSYKVTSVRTASTVGDSFSKEKANGIFLLVDVALTNKKNEPATIMSDALRIVGGNKSVYTVSDDALLAVDDQFVLEEIQPGLTETGVLVFDVPESAVRGAELQVEDLFSDDKGRIKLGV